MAKQGIHGNVPFSQGKYTPNNPEKYLGDKQDIIYRSSWELAYMKICDMSPNVVQWSSEPIKIPYFNPLTNKMHYYIADFWVKTLSTTMIIEVKPSKQTKRPILKEGKQTNKQLNNYNYEMEMYIKNIAKWNAANDFCKKQGWVFRIVSEKDLGLK